MELGQGQGDTTTNKQTRRDVVDVDRSYDDMFLQVQRTGIRKEDEAAYTKGKDGFQSSLPLKKRHPTCARCRNHGLISNLKGHKRVCQYRLCQCNRCNLVVQRRQVVAQQVAMTREHEKERQNFTEQFDHLTESQRYYHDSGATDLHQPLSAGEVPKGIAVDSPNANTACSTEACATWNPSESYSEPITAPNNNTVQAWTYGHSYNPIPSSAISSQTGEGGYMTMKQQAFRSVDTATASILPYPWASDFSAPGIKSSTVAANFSSLVDAGFPSVNYMYPLAYQAHSSPFETQYLSESAPNIDGTISIPAHANTSLFSVLPDTSVTFATPTYMSTSCSSRFGRTTLPPLDLNQENIFDWQSPTPYGHPPVSSVTYSDLPFNGNPTPPSGTPYSMPYINYPSPTLPTQTNPVSSFTQTSNPADSTSNFVFPGTYLESSSPSQPQASHVLTAINAPSSSSNDLPRSDDLQEDEIDVCSAYQYGFNGT